MFNEPHWQWQWLERLDTEINRSNNGCYYGQLRPILIEFFLITFLRSLFPHSLYTSRKSSSHREKRKAKNTNEKVTNIKEKFVQVWRDLKTSSPFVSWNFDNIEISNVFMSITISISMTSLWRKKTKLLLSLLSLFSLLSQSNQKL